MAKNKVKVEYDVDMEKERRKKQQKNGKTGFAIRRSNILLYVLLLVVEILFYYFLTPAINVHTSEFWTWVIITLAAIGFCSFDFKGTRITRKGNIKETVGSTKVVMVLKRLKKVARFMMDHCQNMTLMSLESWCCVRLVIGI